MHHNANIFFLDADIRLVVIEGSLNPKKYQDETLQPVIIPQSAAELYISRW